MAAVSFVILTLALALARQIPGEVGVVSVFRSVVPMAALFGLGLGCVLLERRSVSWLLPGGLGLVFVFILVGRGVLLDQAPPGVLLLLKSQPPPGPVLRLPLLPAALAAFVCPTLPFVALGQTLARAVDGHPRLVAVGWALLGALLGTTLHALAAWLALPPWAGVAGITSLAALVLARGPWPRLGLLASGLVFLLFARSPVPGQWSPYALVQHLATSAGLAVFTNATFHEITTDLTTEDPRSRRAQTAALAGRLRPHRLFREIHGRGPESVLVLGAGVGSDVAVALDAGVSRAVAVEIDPVILDLGRELNPSAPYADPRVEVVVDDPRHHLRSSRETFDLVVFGTLESPVILPGQAILPRRRFVFTREAFTDARERLAAGGLLAIEHPSCPDRLLSRLDDTLRSVFDGRSRMIVGINGAPCGATLVASRDLDTLPDDPETVARPGGGRPATDDWPYLDLDQPGFAPLHLRLLGAMAVLVLGVLLLLLRVHPVTGLHVDYLLLGMGSTLMGSIALVRLVLQFGGTWPVHAVAVSSALVTVLLANTVVLRARAPSLSLAWGGLLLALVVNSLVPVSSLGTVGIPTSAAAAALLVGVPVLCAALCFSHLFRGEPVAAYPLGLALVGAMAGLLLQHVSIATGMRAVWLLVLGVYALAWVATRLIPHPPARA